MENELLIGKSNLGCSQNAINSFMRITPKYTNNNYKGMNRLLNKNIVVTSADNGVSKAVAIAFAKEGADIVMVYDHLNQEKGIREIAKVIKQLGRKVYFFKSFAFDEFKCRELFERILKKVPNIDVLINNFSVSNKKEIAKAHYLIKKNDTLRIQSLFTTARIAPEYVVTNGVIVNSVTICSYPELDQLIFYATLKAAVRAYTKEMNRMLLFKNKKLRINGITTGLIWAETLPDTVPDYSIIPSTINSVVPQHPYEVAPLFVFAASEESKSIAGETLDAESKNYKQ